jgi:hypothetical protein
VIRKSTVTWFVVWAALTCVLFVPDYVRQHRCHKRSRPLVSDTVVSSEHGEAIIGFDPCFIDGALPVWKEILTFVWLGTFIGWPILFVQDIWQWVRNRRRLT